MADGSPSKLQRLHDKAAEKAVLASMLLDNAVIPTIALVVAARDFYVPSHGLIFDAIVAVKKGGDGVDVVTLASALREKDSLNTVGGAQYLGEITDDIPTVAHCEAHARIVADLAARRRALEVAQRIEAAAMTMDAAELHSYATKALRDAQVSRQAPLLTSRVLSDQLFTRYVDPSTDAVSGAIPSGLRDLDQLLTLNRGRQYVFAARPAMGKSALTGQILHAVGSALAGDGSEPGTSICFAEEMPALEVAGRWVVGYAGVPARAVDDRKLDDDQYTAWTNALAALDRAKVVYDDTPAVTIERIESVARSVALEGPVDIILVDYLQLLTMPKAERYDLAVGEVTRRLKALAKELNCVVITVSQLNRECESRPNKRPMLSDLRDSGRIEQDADGVVFIYRDEVYHRDTADKGYAEVIVAKQRNGPIGMVRLRWIAESVRFEDCNSYVVAGRTFGDPADQIEGF